MPAKPPPAGGMKGAGPPKGSPGKAPVKSAPSATTGIKPLQPIKPIAPMKTANAKGRPPNPAKTTPRNTAPKPTVTPNKPNRPRVAR